MSLSSAAASTIKELRRQLLQTHVEQTERVVVSSGFEGLDQLLPDSGLTNGSVIEWISDAPGLRTASVALKCAAKLLNKPGALAVVDADHDFHPASIEHLGIPLERLLLIRPGATRTSEANRLPTLSSEQRRTESLWALEQLARCSGVCVLLAWIDRLSSTAQRRLQLAVENSGVTVMLMRPSIAARQTSWSDLRFQVSPVRNRRDSFDSEIQVRLLRCRNAVQSTGRVIMKASDETGDVCEISELARSAQTASATG